MIVLDQTNTYGFSNATVKIIDNTYEDMYDTVEAPGVPEFNILVPTVQNVGMTNVLELYQPGFEGSASIPVYVNQDGTFSAMLFKGTYMLVAKDGAGPWVDSGTELYFDVRGDTEIDFPVTPYYVIRNVKFSVDDEGMLTAAFSVERGAFTLINGKPDALIESISLYINNTRFVDDVTNRKKVDDTSLTIGDHTITVSLKDAALADYPVLYARIAVGTKGVSPKIYSPGSVQVK